MPKQSLAFRIIFEIKKNLHFKNHLNKKNYLSNFSDYLLFDPVYQKLSLITKLFYEEDL